MYGANNAIERDETNVGLSSMLSAVYGWMTFALAISGITAWLVGTDPKMVMNLAKTPVMIILILAELGLVFGLSAFIQKMSASLATSLFILYSALNGLTLSFIFVAYTMGSIALTFGVTAATFGVMAVWGTVTKSDLTKLGSLCMMALIGLIIASLVSFFWTNNMFEWIISCLGVLIFVGLTAYDAQKIKQMYFAAGGEWETNRKIAILGALALYLDFINLFLYLLRILGNRRN